MNDNILRNSENDARFLSKDIKEIINHVNKDRIDFSGEESDNNIVQCLKTVCAMFDTYFNSYCDCYMRDIDHFYNISKNINDADISNNVVD